MPFVVISDSQFPLLIFFTSSWYQKPKIGLRMSLRNKKMINYHIKELYKTTKSNFYQFFISHWLLHKGFLIRLHQQVFIVYKKGENLKVLIEIFCQKNIVSNGILAFLDHLKPKIFFTVVSWTMFWIFSSIKTTTFRMSIQLKRDRWSSQVFLK